MVAVMISKTLESDLGMGSFPYESPGHAIIELHEWEIHYTMRR
jgi:hypothetical protein